MGEHENRNNLACFQFEVWFFPAGKRCFWNRNGGFRVERGVVLGFGWVDFELGRETGKL